MRLLSPEDGGMPTVGRTEVLNSEASVVEQHAGKPVEVIVVPDTQEEEAAVLPREGRMPANVLPSSSMLYAWSW